MVYIPAADDFFPFPDNHFDVITSSTFSSVVKSQSWLPVLQECHRCLQKGGWLEIQSMDAVASRQGELLKSWVDSRLLPGIEDLGLVVNPSKRVHYLEVAGFTEIKTCKIALPAVGKGGGQEQDATKVMVQAGRHYYRELYGESLKPLSLGTITGRLPWWWYNKSMRQECEREGTLFGYMISFGRKEFA
jgi:ubiquinone/menaquinone biosynthesis C-methylase UbiE